MSVSGIGMVDAGGSLLQQMLSRTTSAPDQSSGARQDDPAQVKKAAQGLEMLFVNQLLKQMRRTIMRAELFDGGQAQRVFEDLMDEKMAEAISERGGIGMGAALFEQIMQLQHGIAPQAASAAQQE